MRRDFTLTAADGAKIYGMIDPAPQPADRLVIISHGLTGGPNEHLHQCARHLFNKSGYDVARFYFYTDDPGARRLKDCTLAEHAADLGAVAAHFAPDYKKVFFIGHSYGGTTMLKGRPEGAAYSFWDAAFVPSWWKMAHYNEAIDSYIFDSGCSEIIGRAMYEEAKGITLESSAALAGMITAPSQVIVAGDDPKKETRRKLFDALRTEKDFVEIAGADHTFSRDDTAAQLAQKTLRWFDKF